MNRGEHVLVNISMSCGNQDSAINLFFILLSLLLLFNEIGLLVAASITDIFTSSSITTAHVWALVLWLVFEVFNVIFVILVNFWHIKKLKNDSLKSIFLILNNFNELNLFDDLDSKSFNHSLDFFLNGLVIESWSIDEGEIIIHHIRLIIVLFDMAVISWDCKNNLLWINTSLDETLDAAVGVKSSSINDAVLDLLLVSESVDEGSSFSQMLVKMWVINT